MAKVFTMDRHVNPKKMGFHMPAEWAPHERTWMIWPCRREVWGRYLEQTCADYAAVAHAILKYEPVTMVVNPGGKAQARRYLASDVEIVELPIDDSWARDSGPVFLQDGSGRLAGLDWRFNAWGGKYRPYDQDAALGLRVIDHVGVTAFRSPLTAEGGGVSVDGEGTVLTTESCFLNANRNPGWTKSDVEVELCASLGAEKVVWLPGNPQETETDGHVDGIAVFVAPGKVLLEYSDDPSNPFRSSHQANLAALEGQTDALGRRIDVVTIEDAWGAEELSERFCLSYINFYLVNGAVVMPAYGVPADDRARDVLQSVFPDRVVEQVRIDHIALGGGGIHCITQQQPRY